MPLGEAHFRYPRVLGMAEGGRLDAEGSCWRYCLAIVAGGKTCGERYLQVVATCVGVEVENFAGDV